MPTGEGPRAILKASPRAMLITASVTMNAGILNTVTNIPDS